jgi:hypothetical protein
MTPDILFSLTSPIAMIGWVLLAVSPLAPRYILPVAGLVLPGVLSLVYVALILAFWTSAEGGFDSLASVMLLFDTPGVALAGWVHFLAFDLFVGGWIARNARALGVSHIWVLLCLPFTFLFGPSGLVLWLVLRVFLSKSTPKENSA